MKTKLLFLLLFVLAIGSLFALDYTIELVDSYGDGWNGGIVTVNVNGTPVLTDLTLALGGGPESHTFSVEGGDVITTVYTAGSWSSENEYQIKNESGEVVAQSGQGGSVPGGLEWTVPSLTPGTPDVPTIVSPADGSNNIAVAGNLEWTTGENTDAVTLYLADNAEFTDAIIMEENATSPYNYSGLETGTLYYWKVVAINTTDNLETSTEATFTTTIFNTDQVVFSGDYVEGESLPLEPYYGYSVSQSIYPADELNIVDQTISEITYLFNQNSSFTDDIIIYMAHTELTTFESSTGWIDEGLTQVYNGTLTTSTENPKVTIELDSPFTYNNVDNLLVCVFETTSGYHTGGDDFLAFSVAENRSIEYHSDSNNPSQTDWTALSGNTKEYLPVTAFTLGEIPQNPIATLSDTELDFGTVNVSETGSDLVSISNTGAGTLNITDIAISGTNADDFAYQTDTEGPWALTTGQELVIQVDFTPSAEGARSASLDITDDLARQVHEIALTGEGFIMPAGNHHNDPIVLTLADEIIETGSTTIYDTYYDFCSSQTVVYKLSLLSEKLMSVSLEGTTWDTKLYIFNSYEQIDQATSYEDAWYYNDDQGSAGQGGAKSKSRDRATWSEMLETLSPAGDYYIIVTGYGSNNGDYTLTINAIDKPIPAAATSPTPADDAVEQATALTLEWTNPAYTETIDLFFGTPGSKSLAKVLDNVAAVEEHEVTDLDANTEYNWYVVCKNTSGDTPSGDILTWSFTTIGSVPLATTYTAPADNAPDIALSGNLTWDAVTGVTGYKVFLSEDNTFAGLTPVEQPGTTYAYSGLDYETTYYWKIVPYNVVGDASEGVEVWSFTTIPDPTIAMPVSLNFEGTTENPAAITLENCTINTHHGSNNNIIYKNVWSSAVLGYIQFQSMNNITANSVITFDYRILDYSSSGPWDGTTLIADHDYFKAMVSTDNGASFTTIDQINSTNHTDSDEFATYTIDISAYAGQTAIFRFEMDWDGEGDYWFDMDNIFFGNAPQVTVNPGDGSPTDPIVLEDENVELEFTAPNPAGFSLQVFMIPSLPTNDSGLPETMDSFLPRTWRVISSVADPGTYNITFDLAGLGISNYGLVRFFKRADGSAAWEDVINLGATLSWNGSKVTISGLDTFSEFVPGIDETLPVTLASFNAVQTTNKFAQINWVTASESEVLGYNLFRAENDNQDQALRVTATMIEASNSPTGASYSFVDDEVEMNTSYYYWLQTNDFDGTSEMFGPVKVDISDQEDHDIEEVLLGTQLLGNYPNPFNPSTTISFSVAEPQVVTIDIYNIKGQLVQKVFNGKVDRPNVKQNVVWNGKDAKGHNAASGIYFTIMKVGNKTFTNKAILLK